MTDCFTPEFRSEVMSRIRSSGTSPERKLFAVVRTSLGHRWRIEQNVRTLPGCPDVVIPTLRLCIFVDGCFFHGCPVHYRPPQTRPDYWIPKVKGNVRRDAKHARALRSEGWSVWRVWEHDLSGKRLEPTVTRLTARLARRRAGLATGS